MKGPQLNRKVKSALLEAGVKGLHFFFTVEEPDSVRLYGIVNSPDEKEGIEKLVKKIKGIKNIKNELVVFRRSMGEG